MKPTHIALVASSVAHAMARYFSNKGQWVTTDAGNKLLIGDDGNVIGGDAGAVNKARGGDGNPSSSWSAKVRDNGGYDVKAGSKTYRTDEDGVFSDDKGKKWVVDEDGEISLYKDTNESEESESKWAKIIGKARQAGAVAAYKTWKSSKDLDETNRKIQDAVTENSKGLSDGELTEALEGYGIKEKKQPKSRAKKEEKFVSETVRSIGNVADIWMDKDSTEESIKRVFD